MKLRDTIIMKNVIALWTSSLAQSWKEKNISVSRINFLYAIWITEFKEAWSKIVKVLQIENFKLKKYFSYVRVLTHKLFGLKEKMTN